MKRLAIGCLVASVAAVTFAAMTDTASAGHCRKWRKCRCCCVAYTYDEFGRPVAMFNGFYQPTYVTFDGGTGRFHDFGMTVAPGENGVLITEVATGSAAWDAGLRSGDVIMSVHDVHVADAHQLNNSLRSNGRQFADLRIRRQGAEQSIQLAFPSASVTSRSAASTPRAAPGTRREIETEARGAIRQDNEGFRTTPPTPTPKANERQGQGEKQYQSDVESRSQTEGRIESQVPDRPPVGEGAKQPPLLPDEKSPTEKPPAEKSPN